MSENNLFEENEINKDSQNPDENQEKENLDTSNINPEDSKPESVQAEIIESVTLEDRIETKVLEESMQQSYLQYAMSVIVSRAVPDVRDGMKPVHRRIMYTMHKLGLSPASKFMKSARVVGEVLGKYHPHGDASVYMAMVRLAQEFSMRYPLVDGQGNFGSIDGDSPAAMRYTESRLQKPSVYLLRDIEKNTVDFVDNYDGTQSEPKVLPNLLPNLLINGQTGIAVGMATEIPPHNLHEVGRAVLHQIENPDCTIDDLLEYIKGPDLPTGATIFGKEDLIRAYKTGKGKCMVQSKADLTENSIIITEIPYQVNKAELLIRVAGLIKEKKIEGIRDIRDESNKEGIRVVIETKRDSSPEVVLNQLYKLSDFQKAQHFNMLALVNDGRQPKLLNLKEILTEFIAHRFEVVTRRTQFELDKAKDEIHILEGLKIALDFIDEVIALIRGSYDKTEAANKLKERFKFSDKQAEAILQMRLQTLTNLDKSKIEDEYNKLKKLIEELEEILNNHEVKTALVRSELEEMLSKFKEERKSKIIHHSLTDFNKEDFIEEEDVFVQLTASQYLKVLPVDTFREQGRGGRGVTSFNPKDEDWIRTSLIANSHDYVFAFTNTGRVFKTRVFDLPSGSRTGRGQSLINYFQLQKDEKITNILTISKEEEALSAETGSFIFATRLGLVKRTKLSQFQNIRKTGIIALGINEGDDLIDIKYSRHEHDNIIISASNGKTVIFDREKLNPLGRTAKGVKGIRLKKGDFVISLEVSDISLAEGGEEDDLDGAIISETKEKEYPSLLVITEKGFGKHTFLAEYRKTNRAASGVKTLNMTKKTGKPSFVAILKGKEDALIVTTKKGITIRIDPADISQLGRSTQGIKVIKLESGDQVVTGSLN